MASDLYILNDETSNDELFPKDKARGLDMSDRPRGYAYGDAAEPFPAELLIPRHEWQARIKEREEKKARLMDLCDLEGLKVKDQEQTNYCWINAPTHCVEIVRMLQGQGAVSLSPASAGAQITGYRNVGGWGKTGLEWIINKGLVPTKYWPANAIDRRYATPENLAMALRFRGIEWIELEPRNLDQQVSCLLRGIPIAVGLNFWSHEVTDTDPLWIDNDIAIGFDNSWGVRYGKNGRGVRQGQRMLADDAVALRTVYAS